MHRAYLALLTALLIAITLQVAYAARFQLTITIDNTTWSITRESGVSFRWVEYVSVAGEVAQCAIHKTYHTDIYELEKQVGASNGSINYVSEVEFNRVVEDPTWRYRYVITTSPPRAEAWVWEYVDASLTHSEELAFHGEDVSGLTSYYHGALNAAIGDLYQASDLEKTSDTKLYLNHTLFHAVLVPGSVLEEVEYGCGAKASFTAIHVGQYGVGIRWVNPALGVDVYSRNIATGSPAQTSYTVYISTMHPEEAATAIPKSRWP